MPLDSPATFSAAFTGDAHFAADDLQRRFPGAPLLLVGMLCAPLQRFEAAVHRICCLRRRQCMLCLQHAL